MIYAQHTNIRIDTEHKENQVQSKIFMRVRTQKQKL